MATRGTIALEFADGSVSQVYVHFDAYLDGVGADLVHGYSDPFELQKLIDQGDMSCIGEPYTARGEDLNIRHYNSVNEYFAECQQEEYDYILRNIDGKATWFVRCYATHGKWVTIEEARQMEAKEFAND